MSKKWFKAAGIRALKTIVQTAIGAIGASTYMGQVSWGLVASAALLAGVLSLFTSIGGLPEVTEEDVK